MSNFKKFFGGAEDGSVEQYMTPSEQEEPPRLLPSKSGTIIAKGQIMEGSLRGEGTVQVEGNMIGEISLRGAVIVTSSGTVKGPVEADVIRVAGHMTGAVTARDHLRLERSGRIDGDISTVSLVVDDGARFNGSCTTIEPSPEVKLSMESGSPDLRELQFGQNYSPETGDEELQQGQQG